MQSNHRRTNETHRERSKTQNQYPGAEYVKSEYLKIGAQGHAPGMVEPTRTAQMADRRSKMKPQPMTRPFEVDELIVWHSPFTHEDMEVIFRGFHDNEASVVYNPKSGWQGVVPNLFLRHKEETK